MSRTQNPANPAEAYETVLVDQLFRPLANEVLRIAGPKPGDDVLDVACGTGIVLRQAAERVDEPGRMAGIDINPAMIELARTVSAADGVQAEWHEGPADSLPFEDETFTRIFCQQGIQFFPDSLAALREMFRVLKEGGEAVVAVWKGIEHHPYIRAMNDVAYERTGVNILYDPFSFDDATDLAGQLREAGFSDPGVEDVSIVSRSSDPVRDVRMQLTGGMAAIPSLQALDDAQRSAIVDDVVAHARTIIERHVEDGVLTLQWHANVVIARK